LGELKCFTLADDVPGEKGRVAEQRGGAGSARVEGGEGEITRIAPQVRNPNRVSVYVGGKYALSLDVFQVTELGLAVGQKVGEERLAELLEASEFGKVYARALKWLLVRPRSEKEVRGYLWRRGVGARRDGQKRSAVDAELVVRRLREKGYVDDEKFARYWAENRLAARGAARRRLEQELAVKGIGEEMAGRALADSGRDEVTEMQKIIAKKSRQYSNDELINYLARQGFEYAQARDVVESWSGEQTGSRPTGW
jgi:regulatory protein